MDPDEALRLLLRAAHRVLATVDPDEDAYDLADRVLALDAWIRSGGFLPAAWSPVAGPDAPEGGEGTPDPSRGRP